MRWVSIVGGRLFVRVKNSYSSGNVSAGGDSSLESISENTLRMLSISSSCVSMLKYESARWSPSPCIMSRKEPVQRCSVMNECIAMVGGKLLRYNTKSCELVAGEQGWSGRKGK